MNHPKITRLLLLLLALSAMFVAISACSTVETTDHEQTNTNTPGSRNIAGSTNSSNPIDTARPFSSPNPTATNVPTNAPIPTSLPELQLKVIRNAIYVRSGPGVDHDPISTLKMNDVVPVLSTTEDETWYEVELASGATGWVGSEVVEIIEGQAVLAVPTQEPTLTPNADVALLRVILSGVNLRSGPGTNYPVHSYLYFDDTVRVIARTQDSGWYNVSLNNGQTAWVAATVTEPLNQQAILTVPVVATIPAPAVDVNVFSNSSSDSSSTQSCCKICTTGKACGNSCINRNYTCHQPPGCACNASSP